MFISAPRRRFRSSFLLACSSSASERTCTYLLLTPLAGSHTLHQLNKKPTVTRPGLSALSPSPTQRVHHVDELLRTYSPWLRAF